MVPSGFFEDGQEYHYSYLAYTNTGVRDPESTSSSFGINGNVIVQKSKGEAIIKVRPSPNITDEFFPSKPWKDVTRYFDLID